MKIGLITICVVSCLVIGSFLGHAHSEQSKIPPSAEVLELIHDSVLFKVGLLDLEFNLLGLDWNDRKEIDTASAMHLTILVSALAVKYNIELPELAFEPDVENGGGKKGPESASVYVKISDEWSEIAKLQEDGDLPIVKFKSGTISVTYEKPIVIDFTPNMKVLLKERTYTYKDDQWVEEPQGNIKSSNLEKDCASLG